MNIFQNKEKQLIAMIHVPALPGTPMNELPINQIVDVCLKEAEIYIENGIKVLAIENMHDTPYLLRNVGAEIISSMTAIGLKIKEKFNVACGIQILAGANKQALAVAQAAGLDFIRAEGFVFAHVADEGIFQSDAGELLRYRKMINAENIFIYTDIKKKHSSHSITSDTDIAETAKAAEFFNSDGIILTGVSTGAEPNIDELKSVRAKVSLPLIIGSGMTAENIEKFFPLADGFIVGSYFKKNGYWKNELDKERISKFVKKFEDMKKDIG